MFKKIHWSHTITTSVIAAVLFCIPLFFFIQSGSYISSWLLYFGCILFLIPVAIYTYMENKRRGGNESTVAMVFASHVSTIIGVIIASILSFILLSFLVPGYLGPGNTANVLEDAPPNTIQDKTGGLSIKVFLAAIVGNFSAGSIVGIILPFAIKRNQTRDSREPVPLQHRTTD